VIALLCLSSYSSRAQEKYQKTDSFFLLRQKGLLGKLGKSISRTPQPEPQKIVNPFLPFANKIIRSIEIFPLGFDRNIDDTSLVKDTKIVKLANRFHHDTRYNVIRKNLFFKPGERFLPLLVSDNETFLRNQPFLRDARIHVAQADDAPDSVDIVVFTRDVFSIGARVNMNTRRVRTELREENLFGTGNEFAINTLFDKDRHPEGGLGGEIVFRNIGGGFLNWYGGFNNFKEAFNSGRLEEASYYMRIEKPFVNRYTQWTANMEIARNETFNAYLPDSSYRADYQYRYHKMDLWAGYNIGYKTKKGRDSENRLRHFVAGRIFYTKFEKQPVKFDSVFNYSYADKNGVLISYTLYRQNYYRTNYLYAFGRNEDVPVGISASIIAGWANIEDRKTPYYGLDLEVSTFTRHSIYSDYKIRLGGFHKGSRFEDANLLLAIDHFTKLRKLGSKWTNRNFLNFSYAKQFNYRYNDPLFLRSDFGLPYFNNIVYPANQRLTTRVESDFYNINKILGFRFAPFAFGDVSFLKRLGTNFSKLKGYPAIGAGIRTRNENLIFETIELRGYYFPVTIDNMKNWKIDLNTRVRFRINNSLIKKPDFIIVN
jgi:hypothetical protein